MFLWMLSWVAIVGEVAFGIFTLGKSYAYPTSDSAIGCNCIKFIVANTHFDDFAIPFSIAAVCCTDRSCGAVLLS